MACVGRIRFDDLTRPDGSFALSDVRDVFVATTADQVVGALHAAEAAAAQGLWVAGFVSYEAATAFDSGLVVNPSRDTGLPLAWFASFATRAAVEPLQAESPDQIPAWTMTSDESEHARAVDEIRRNIARGSYYQVNLTTRLRGRVDDSFALYGRLARTQRGAYNAYLETGNHTVVSCSPELFFERTDGVITARPMKGTATRGRWSEDDEAQRERLRRSEKDRAENAMIVDLIRNDLSRVAEIGSVEVTSLFDVERFPTVWQLTSTVTARQRPGTELVDAFRALFPSGSITGAPKQASMAAIADLERAPRGVYCGAIGYLAPGCSPGPSARFSVGIRTVTVDATTELAEYGTGGGITWSSVPAQEWAELHAKTHVLRLALRESGLLETFRYDPASGIRNLELHLARLEKSCRYSDIALDTGGIRVDLLCALEGRVTMARVRLHVSVDGQTTITIADFSPDDRTVSLMPALEQVSSDDVGLFHKFADRRRYEALRPAGLSPDEDVVLHNEFGQVTETTIANLAVRIGERWFTPALACGLLPGVERQRLIADGTLAERVISLEEFAEAQEIAVVNSLRGWRRARLSPRWSHT